MKAISGSTLDWSNAKLRVKKAGDTVQFYILKNEQWAIVGELDISDWGKSLYVGIATLSHDNSQLTEARYSEIDLKY